MSGTSDRPAESAPFWLTTVCERVQAELLDLADALQVAALEAFPDLARSFLVSAADFRRHLREHVADVEHPQGLFSAIVRSDPRLGQHVAALSEEHLALDRSVEALAGLLERFDPADAAVADKVRAAAAALAALVRRHQQTAGTMARSACCGPRGCCCRP
jgi:hypothetical protein